MRYLLILFLFTLPLKCEKNLKNKRESGTDKDFIQTTKVTGDKINQDTIGVKSSLEVIKSIYKEASLNHGIILSNKWIKGTETVFCF
ncbi:hypothetical protein [Tenacibaculum caenipelagi]|uniref:Uncharacterized protein n=1 Tax=Tenacibaculum caenipelagi TaxID=1325435 RepID=A0A4R6TLB8_9FLAO|nr:hypothetical protein [Tenacibaculum caenipelagi]TDQ30348.1 hypothetical protein DFQ07_0691 [Tenacibaculum caenipelagi]